MLKNLLGSRLPKKPAHHRNCRPNVEALEDRQVLSAVYAGHGQAFVIGDGDRIFQVSDQGVGLRSMTPIGWGHQLAIGTDRTGSHDEVWAIDDSGSDRVWYYNNNGTWTLTNLSNVWMIFAGHGQVFGLDHDGYLWYVADDGSAAQLVPIRCSWLSIGQASNGADVVWYRAYDNQVVGFYDPTQAYGLGVALNTGAPMTYIYAINNGVAAFDANGEFWVYDLPVPHMQGGWHDLGVRGKDFSNGWLLINPDTNGWGKLASLGGYVYGPHDGSGNYWWINTVSLAPIAQDGQSMMQDIVASGASRVYGMVSTLIYAYDYAGQDTVPSWVYTANPYAPVPGTSLVVDPSSESLLAILSDPPLTMLWTYWPSTSGVDPQQWDTLSVVHQATPTEAFVAHAYEDLLDRRVDAMGLAAWTGLLDSGSITRPQFTSDLVHSDEYLTNRVLIPDYQGFLGRAPTQQEVNGWLFSMHDHFFIDLNTGKLIYVKGLTDEQVAADILGSPECYTHDGGADGRWLDALYQEVLERKPTAAEEAAWLAVLAQGMDRRSVAFVFETSPERDQNLVQLAYNDLLFRGPGNAELSAWVGALQQGLTDENMLADFVGSQEYYQKHNVW
jgi:hypothetical protein